MKRTLLATVITALYAGHASADSRCGNETCALPDPAGKTWQTNRVLARVDGAGAPSVEYRRPDEVVVIREEAATSRVVMRSEPLIENRRSDSPADQPAFPSGQDGLSESERAQLAALAARLAGKPGLRLRFVGHADEQRLTPETRARFRDNEGLSLARAQRVQRYVAALPGMASVPMEAAGMGDTRPVKTGCDPRRAYLGNAADLRAYQACLAPNRRVEVEIWYDQIVGERAVPVTEALPSPTPRPAACKDQAGGDAGLPFRISVDGEPLDAADVPNTADVTRCTDLALEKADIQVRFDGFETTPMLDLIVTPDGALKGSTVSFMPYTNYAAFIRRAEVRIFPAGASTQSTPLAVLPLDAHTDTAIEWPTPVDRDAIDYVLRVYDEKGRFDETYPRTLALLDRARPVGDEDRAARERLVGYGENNRRIKNIPVIGGAVTVNGERLAPQAVVTVFGRPVQVDANGKFAVRQILPAGPHVVTVATESAGQRAEFSRNLYIPDNDWFYVALADLTVGQNNVKGPARLVTGDTSRRYEEKVYADGRLAFYLKGKIKGDTLLTASADTREQPLDELFTNFNSKDPRYLLRRLDPNAYYPVYGDDSTLVEDAPTQGKFYVKLQRGGAHVLWGSFQTTLTGTDLVNYSRGLYGAQARYKSPETLLTGERRTEAELFAADPGTLASVEEFRGTGGSLYYLRHQDVLAGSERLRVEVRDKDSGIVLKSTTLVAGQDYEFNALQGRVFLRTPLPAVADASSVILTGPLSGHPVYLVAGYEYTPGVSATENLTLGGRASHWVNDHVRLGVTGYKQDGTGTEQKLVGADATLRYKPGTYVKIETAQSEGPGVGALSSQNGGFDFGSVPQTATAGIEARAHRIEASADLEELGATRPGRVSAYWIKRGDGYSAPGQLTSEAVEQHGAQVNLKATDKLELAVRADQTDGKVSGSTRAAELNARYDIDPSWAIEFGVRHDDRETVAAAGSSSLLAETGTRTDAAAKLVWRALGADGKAEDWAVYGLVQGTLETSGTRRDNDRYGAGGRMQVNDRIRLSGEVTDGDGGTGGKLGIDYRLSDRNSVYLNYLIDPDRTDPGYRGRVGSLTAGAKSRYSDSLSVYAEERYQTADNGPAGLIHAFGLDLAANDRWSHGLRFEKGTTSDPATGDLDRTAISLSTNYQYEKIRYGGALEFRHEDGNTTGKRDTWLTKNTLAYQASPDWRLLGRLNLARSTGQSTGVVDADFTEVVLGFGYRPVLNDRLNALFRYTYLAELPSPGQLAAGGGAANAYEQRSHVLSADAIYDVLPKLSLGGKIGYRFGELRDVAANGNWFGSRAWLGIVRVDWHVVHEWDAMCEWRVLDAQEAGDTRSGALVGVYRHINPHIKVGLGYNFTDFSDDLTNLDYRSQGWFVNLLGKL
ncbi:MAG: OmpA family protein [Thiobacillus sp.]|nr:OmpA family protein [Thiobacillus sp.]